MSKATNNHIRLAAQTKNCHAPQFNEVDSGTFGIVLQENGVYSISAYELDETALESSESSQAFKLSSDGKFYCYGEFIEEDLDGDI